jgi:hypothetical protein
LQELAAQVQELVPLLVEELFMKRTMKTMAVAASLAMSAAAMGQESMYTQAATMPSPGAFSYRPGFHYFRYGADPVDANSDRTDKYEFMNSVSYGIVRNWAVTVDVPVVWENEKFNDGTSDSDKGVEDIEAMVKWRFYQSDSGTIDTIRAAALFGAHFASGDDDDFSSESVNPMIGGVITIVRGRHGFNQDLIYTWNTGGTREANLGGEGPDEALAFNTSWVFRLYPDRFTSEHSGGLYSTLELNGLYETNGDTEIRLSPGLMWEDRKWTAELMMQLPLWEDVDERPTLEFGIGVGLRISF